MIRDSVSSFNEAMRFVDNTLPGMSNSAFEGSLGLNRAKELLERLGQPQKKFKSIHIAGTAGKGTTSYMIDALLRSTDSKVGLTLSPYVYNPKERFLLDGEFASDLAIVEAMNKLLPHLRQQIDDGSIPSRFETLFALTMVLFQQAKR